MTTRVSTFSLRLPISLKAAVEKLAAADGTSMNQFLVMAAAEKLAAITTAEAFFADRNGRGDPEAAIRLLTRPGGETPRPDDELPD
ncbi:MAG TPA: hypothetical protein VNT30_07440 [Stellaceae bacterium]|nr:hypothetical protein [Stellaceae bacterium]